MDKLHISWTTGEKDVAMKVILPYIFASKANGWWDEINVIIWGPSAKLVAEDAGIQAYLRDVLDSGITLEACILCTDSYGITEKLRGMEINVRYMSLPFTEYVKSGDKVLTF